MFDQPIEPPLATNISVEVPVSEKKEAIMDQIINGFTSSFEQLFDPGERRVDLSCGVSYGEDLEKVKRIALEAIEENLTYNDQKPIEFYYSEFGGSSINFSLRFWLDQC